MEPLKANDSPKHKYRPEIDGLRAIAVVSVVLFHAFPEMIHGGFVGVDIFFVISGFLISKIILEKRKLMPNRNWTKSRVVRILSLEGFR